jgi:SAM-dependent methyltransferase
LKPPATDLDIQLACPSCRTPLVSEGDLHCTSCGTAFPVRDGLPILLTAESTDATSTVAELYDGVAEDYDLVFASHVVEHYLARRAALVQRLLSRGAVLDVGCGTGILAARLANLGYEVAGVDLAPAMLARAQRRGLRHVYAARSTAMPFENGSFDLAITVATLHHLETPERVAGTIGEMGRVVRDGGFVVLWDHNPLNPYWPLLMHRVPQDSGDERLVPLEEILADVAAAGLAPHSIRQVGLVPDFMPAWLMPFWRTVEAAVEATPMLRRLTAHNVVVARKR